MALCSPATVRDDQPALVPFWGVCTLIRPGRGCTTPLGSAIDGGVP